MVFTRETIEQHKQRIEFIRKHIAETNAAFLDADKPTRRVMLAGDVLLQLGSGRMVAGSAYLTPLYCGPEFISETGSSYWNFDQELGDALLRIPKCVVCGIGALFVAAVERADKLKVGESFSRGSKIQYLAHLDLFAPDELRAVEEFFELMPEFADDKRELALPWLSSKPDARLTRIAQAIIDTEGKAPLTHELLAKVG